MGIGGLDTEFGDIFRRAFASRVFPPGLVEKLGIQHVKGKICLPASHPILAEFDQVSFFMVPLVPERPSSLVKSERC